MPNMRRLEVLEALKEAGISERGLAEFFALTDEQFELWDRICWKPLTRKVPENFWDEYTKVINR
jgi:hypothetical protein